MVIDIRINHSNRSTPQSNKILENTNPSVRAIHLTIDGLSGLNKWIRPFINANNNTAATSANTHIPEFLIIPEYKYIPYRGQTFLEKKDLRGWEVEQLEWFIFISITMVGVWKWYK